MNRFAFITSSNGLGQEMARNLIKKGWNVFLGYNIVDYRELDKIKDVSSNKLMKIPLNVTDEASVRMAVEEIVKKTDCLDLLINNIDECNLNSFQDIWSLVNFDEVKETFNINVLGQIRIVNALLALLNKSDIKRLCFITSIEGSINASKRISGYGYCMSKAALNMNIAIMFNKLRPQGYTFRLFDPNYNYSELKDGNPNRIISDLKSTAACAVQYYLGDRFKDEHNEDRNDENRLVIRDRCGRELTW